MAKGKFNTELMYKLSDGMKSSAATIEELHRELTGLIDESKNDWNDDLSKKFFEDLELTILNLRNFFGAVPKDARELRKKAENYDETFMRK